MTLIQSKFGTDNGRGYIIPEMTTQEVFIKNLTLNGNDARLRLTIKNFADERAPCRWISRIFLRYSPRSWNDSSIRIKSKILIIKNFKGSA